MGCVYRLVLGLCNSLVGHFPFYPAVTTILSFYSLFHFDPFDWDINHKKILLMPYKISWGYDKILDSKTKKHEVWSL